MLPVRPGAVERRSADYVRHGTRALYAAIEVGLGRVLGRTTERHRALEFRDFLDLVVETYPGQTLAVVLDNVSSHKTPAI